MEKVEALDTFGGDDPLAAPVAVATAKRYLDAPDRYVRLRELVGSIGREAREQLYENGRFDPDWRPPGTDSARELAGFGEEMKRRILSHERTCETSVGVMAAAGCYADEQQARAFRELLELVSSPPRTGGLEVWNGLELYPGLFLLYAGGVSAAGAENWPFLKALLRDSVFTDISGTAPLVLKVYPWAVDQRKEVTNAAFFENQSYYEPMAERLFRTLHETLREYLPLDFRYQDAFHRFEALLALTYVDINKVREPPYHEWVPLGRFAPVHKRTGRSEASAFSALRAEYDEQRGRWAPVISGLLKEPVSSDGTIRTVDTVGYDFDVVVEMIRGMRYF